MVLNKRLEKEGLLDEARELNKRLKTNASFDPSKQG